MLDLNYLAELAERHRDDLGSRVRDFDVGGVQFEFDRMPAVMGVVNMSRDSWYRESVVTSTTAAVARGRVLSAQGASIIDLGAESTLPQAERVGEDSQISQLVPVVEELASEGVVTSVETYSVEVARACLRAGARVLNLTGTTEDREVFELAAEYDSAVIVCFVEGRNVREVAEIREEPDPIPFLIEHFEPRLEIAEEVGLDRVFVDPGLGFYYGNLGDGSERVRRQIEIFLNTFRLNRLGYPVCHALPHAFDFFQEEVRSAEPMFAVLAALGGCGLFRTHEVPKVKAVLETLAVID